MNGCERESASAIQRIVVTPWIGDKRREKGTGGDRDADVFEDESHFQRVRRQCCLGPICYDKGNADLAAAVNLKEKLNRINVIS